MTTTIEGPPAEDLRQLWATIAAEGKAPAELRFAASLLPTYSVGIESWIDRLARTYLRDLTRKYAHFKLVIAPYGGGKTHFLMAAGARALEEGYGVAYVACRPGISLASPLDIYRSFIAALHLPGAKRPGLSELLCRIREFKVKQIEAAGAPDPEAAFEMWLTTIAREEYPEPSFGRVIAAALHEGPDWATASDAATRWLRGEINTLTRDDLSLLRLARVPAASQQEFGRNLLFSVIQFAAGNAGVLGIAILFDEVETLFSAHGRALQRVLSAMRVMLDLPHSVPGGLPLFGIFTAVPDVLDQLPRYLALSQRLAVVGAAFHEGNDLAAQIHLHHVGNEEDLLRAIGERLIDLATTAIDHKFERELQSQMIRHLAQIAVTQNLEIDARRIFVKTCAGILQLQAVGGERIFTPEELIQRYRGSFELLRERESTEEEP